MKARKVAVMMEITTDMPIHTIKNWLSCDAPTYVFNVDQIQVNVVKQVSARATKNCKQS
jgi:hypothetical protein